MGLGDFWYSLKWFLQGLVKKPLEAVIKLFENKTYKMAAVAFLGLLVVIPLVIILSANVARNTRQKVESAEFKPDVISEEEIFISDEPDFLPKVIFEETQRKSWDNSEAASFWTDPSGYSDTEWKSRITESLDGLLERVP
jgi:hypothetical protein